MSTNDKLSKKEIEALEKEHELKIKKRIYYLQEFSILIITLVAVVFSDAFSKRASGEIATAGDILFDWVNLILSAILAVICYSIMFTKFKYNDSAKPPFMKRMGTALMNGIAWRTMIGWTNQG